MSIWPFSRKRTEGGPIEAAMANILNARSFSAAEMSEHLAPWTFDGGFSNSEIGATLDAVRSRSRDMAKNSEYFARWLQLFVANVVGPNGFKLKSRAEKSMANPSTDEAAAYFLETHWTKWASSAAYVDEGGRLDLPALLRLAVENWARDGEAFILINRNAQNPYGISLRLVRPDCVDNFYSATIDADRAIRLGVEVEMGTGRPIAYYFDSSREDLLSTVYGSKHRVRVPAASVIHLFLAHDAGQVRGFPMGHPFLKKLKMLDEFDNAELVAARDEANTLGVYKAPAGREAEIKNLAKDGSTRDRLEQKSAPGSRIVLPQGWDYEPKTPHHPNAGLPAFKVSMLRDVASGAGVEYANFANDWSGVSYSSVRAGTLAERDQWLTHQATVVSRVLNPLFEAWLASFLSCRISGNYSASDFDRLRDHDFVGRRWQWVDPMKDVQATVLAIQNGLMTHSQAAAEYGTDTDDNIEENGRISDAFDAAGLSNPLKPTPVAVPANTEYKEDENEPR